MKQRAIFLDRDGTINEEAGYITDLAQFRLYDFAAPAIRMINEAGWLAILVTNQAGIARGHFTEDFLGEVNDLMISALAREGARLDAIYYCPHYPAPEGEPETAYRRECDCRKPRPGLLHRAQRDFSLSLDESYVIGDRYRDLAAGFEAGTRGVLVLTGYGREELDRDRDTWPRPPIQIADHLLAAVQWILAQK